MTEALAHRGPDAEGYYFDEHVGLGHRRLAIIDLASGHQPMFNEDKSIVLIFNGQIYNYQALRTELARAGHHFRTESDTEVIIRAWEEWGPESVKRLRGMFAFALYDKKSPLLFLARDRLGKKPLYYSVLGNGELIFASELKALLVHPFFRRQLDPVSIDRYFAFGYIPEPNTVYRNVFKLPAAHTLEFRQSGERPKPIRYWRLSAQSTPCSEVDAARELIARLDEATRIRLMSEVPLGAFLSGGVDSSAVVSSMARQTHSPVKTFALGFNDEEQDELHHARRIADRYGTQHVEGSVNVDPLSTYLHQAAVFDEPFADSSSVPTLEVCRLTRQRVTVALSGDAGDELFAGYRRYSWLARTERMRRAIPAQIRRPLFGTLGALYPKLDWAPQWLRARTTFSEIAVSTTEGYFRSLCKVPDEMRHAIFSGNIRQAIAGQHPAEVIAASMEEAESDDPVTCAQYADLMTYLPGDILTKVDRCSMSVSLEVRAPMLDHELVEWAFTLPSKLKLTAGESKYILKRALEPFVPKENLYRTKQGFATNLAAHFRKHSTRISDALTRGVMADSGLFNVAAIETIHRRHNSGLEDHSQALWSLLMFSGFLSEVHFGPAATRPALRDAIA